MRSTVDHARDIVSGLTLDQKISLLSGADFWHSTGIPAAGIPAMMLTDGPHGLRKQTGDTTNVELTLSVPATCFPTAATLGATWDPDLLEEIGAALGRECRAEDVPVLLGPGLNLKRHPAGGRSFEYFSEDPLVSGRLAGALVRGIQSQGVAACLKHLAANNQEQWRMTLDTIVDERTLRELYLTGFEIAVRESDPWTVMCSYNLVNGTHTGESRDLLTTILRDEWGFDGLVMTDWLATFDRAAAVAAGLDLEMPSSGGTWDREVRLALERGTLAVADLDTACVRIADLALRTERGRTAAAPDFDAHHALARRAAAAGSVLLTNDGLLPLAAKGTIAVIGAFAEDPRYQGAGSSLVTPTRIDGALEQIRAAAPKANITYAPGYDPATGDTTDVLVAEAQKVARGADAVVLLAGLPAIMESEGFDRDHLDLPAGHTRLIEAVTAANPRVAVVLLNGSAVEIPWERKAAAILEVYLGGQAGGAAIADVILGAAEPGGRLAESFPVSAQDLPADHNFRAHPTQTEYREGLYVGYRFHDTARVPARFPFGHGLGYTTWEYSDVTAQARGEGARVTVTVKNTGTRAGSEVVQVYVRDVESTVYRPEKELRDFRRVTVAPGKSTTLTFDLPRRAFAVWDVATHSWAVEAGEFDILVGHSSADIRGAASVTVSSDDRVSPAASPSRWVATDAEFAAMLGRPIPRPRPLLPFHRDSTVSALSTTLVGRAVRQAIVRQAIARFGAHNDDATTQAATAAFLANLPLRGIAMASNGALTLRQLDRIIRALNAVSPRAWFARRRR